MISHLVKMASIIAVAVLCICLPFLPGQYDGLAVPLSTTVQLLGAAGLLLVPIGILWLLAEMVWHFQRDRTPPNPRRRVTFALASLIAASLLVIVVSLFVLLGISTSLGILTLVLGFTTVSRAIPKLRQLKTAEAANIPPAPLYLIVIPLAVLLFPVALAPALTKFSRNRAIANSNEFVSHIERYHAEYGHYPVSLAAMWKDYYPDVVGIEKFHYAPYGKSYNLFFEQPRFLFDNIGTREWVVYNPNDEHRMFSHTAWFLLLTPEELERSQGWYAVQDAGVPHWKSFWFD
jgi:hypothetical protein